MYNYLQRAWSDATDNVGLEDIKEVIKEIQQMDEEHGAFWVGVGDDEVVMEVDISLRVVGIFNGDGQNQIVKQTTSWQEVEGLYSLLLNGEFEKLKTALIVV